MALTDDTEALMLAYVYGELSASDALAFERRMDAETPEGAELRAEVEGMRASRALFGRDAQFGVTSGIDLPPAHLVDAIMNAEAIARPSEIRQARSSAEASAARVAERALTRAPDSKTFAAKLSRWLLGGGVAVGAAAAIFVVVSSPRSDEELVEHQMAEAPSMSAAPVVPATAAERSAATGDAERPAVESPPPAADPKPSEPRGSAVAGAAVDESGAFAGLDARKGDADATLSFDGAGRGLGAAGADGDARLAQPTPRDGILAEAKPAPSDALVPEATPTELRAQNEGEKAAGKRAETTADRKRVEPTADRKRVEPTTEGNAESKNAKDQGGRSAAGEAQSPAEDALADRYGDVPKAKAKGGAKEEAARPAAKKEPPAEERMRANDKASSPGGGSLGMSSGPVTTSPPRRMEAPPPPPTAMPAPEAPVTSTVPMAPAPSPRAASPAKPAPPAKTSVRADDASEADEGYSTDAPAAPLNVVSPDELKKRRAAGRVSREKADVGKSSAGGDAERARRLEQSNVALATAEREANSKRWLNALDQYATAEVLDHERSLGATPLVGQMRMLVELKRPVDAAKVARRLGRWDVKSFDVPAGLRLGAQIAEQIGDERLARELWTRLLDVPAEKANARAQLNRLDRAQVMRRAPSSAVDSEAASSDAPAAASESTKD